MPVSVTMPRLGESVTEGTVTRWLKQEGERVEADEPLLEVSTDKVDTEIPSPASGVLHRIVVHEDETAEVGSELAVIDGDGDPGASPAPAQESAAAADAPAVDAPAASATVAERRPEPAVDEPSTGKPVEVEAPAPATPSAASADGAGVATVVTMPALGESVAEGTVTRWLKQVGDQVSADEPLLEVSTDKVDTEIPSPASGTLLEIAVQQDETVAVGARLAVIGSSAAAPSPVPAAAAPAPSAAPAPEPAPVAPAAPTSPAPAAAAQTAAVSAQPRHAAPAPVNGEEPGGYVTPLVRKLA
ncbi:MAG TPA: biotin/lipoyl-containing protein, partial [Rugosimonospora sp.]|nr:biotin/lipoyl-containing protein [Rugosimonospora sp.]